MTEENEARLSLLSYYSSQTTSHGVILVTVELVALSVIQFVIQLNSNAITSWWFALLMSVLAALMFRTFGRLLYWGYLSGAILGVDAKLSDAEAKVVPIGRIKEGLTNPNLITYKLHNAAVRAVLKDHSIGRLLGQPGWEPNVVAVAFWASSFLILAPNLPPIIQFILGVTIVLCVAVTFWNYYIYRKFFQRAKTK